jgi:hypothetical protein
MPPVEQPETAALDQLWDEFWVARNSRDGGRIRALRAAIEAEARTAGAAEERAASNANAAKAAWLEDANKVLLDRAARYEAALRDAGRLAAELRRHADWRVEGGRVAVAAMLSVADMLDTLTPSRPAEGSAE